MGEVFFGEFDNNRFSLIDNLGLAIASGFLGTTFGPEFFTS
jgi:hypothetical protein